MYLLYNIYNIYIYKYMPHIILDLSGMNDFDDKFN